MWRQVSGKVASRVAVRSESGVAGEGRVVGVPKFHSWGKCTMPRISTQIGCPTLPLASINLFICLFIYLFVCLFIYLFVHLFIYLINYLFIYVRVLFTQVLYFSSWSVISVACPVNASWHSFSPKHCARWILVQVEYGKRIKTKLELWQLGLMWAWKMTLIEDNQERQSECAHLLCKGQRLCWQRHRNWQLEREYLPHASTNS